MSPNFLDIVKLKIVLNTNKNIKVDLTSKLFIFDKDTVSGEYPYLCTNAVYSNTFLKNKTMYERVETFFNRQKFDEFVISSTQKKKKLVDVDAADIEKLKISEKNIIIMLNAIFPISFPIEDQVDRVSEQNANFNLSNIFDNIWKKSEYVYLNIDKPSTVIQVKWLDTLHDNPVYYKIYKLIETYHNFLKDYINDALNKLKEKEEEEKKEEEKKEKKYTEVIRNINSNLSTVKQLSSYIKKIDYTKFTTDNVKEIVYCKIIWKLYFLFSDFKPKSEAYYSFVNEYVNKIINYNKNNKQNDSRYIMQGQTNEQLIESNERQFNNDIKGLQFYLNFKKEIVEFSPPKRRSISPETRALFKDDKLDIDTFEEAYNGGKSIIASIDKLTDESHKITYEIQLGIALVGGKINTTNRKFWCEYNANKYGDDLEFIRINPDFDGIRLYKYIDLENTSKTENYNNIINAPTIDKPDTAKNAPTIDKPDTAKNGGTRKRRSNQRRSNRRRSNQRRSNQRRSKR